jgi:hypothetical protein
MNSGTTLDAAGILAAARDARREANAAETRVLTAALEWAHLHVVDDPDDAATWWSGSKWMGQDTGIPIAGEGCPLVSEFAVCELATALGMSAVTGRMLVAHALELAHRLPKIWARVQRGTLAPWRARRIADLTLSLSPDAAAYVDTQLAPFAHKTGPAQAERLVAEAIARFMPEYARDERERASDQRRCDVDVHQVSFAGTAKVYGELDLADALDLDDALAHRAQALVDLGSTDTLDVRRAVAMGMLARGEQPLDLTGRGAGVSTGSTTGTGEDGEPVRTETGRVPRRTSGTFGGRRRDIVLYVHLSEDALISHDPNAPVRVENAGGHVLTAGQVAEWCGRPDTDRVIVKPVIDLTAHLATDAYQIPDVIAEHVELRDSTCVFPWCHRPARGCDKDHAVPYDPDGPPGQTHTGNLAPLCRLHHRVKTHARWTYTILEPGVYLWRSPHGYTWVRDHTGTTDLTPGPIKRPPVDPPPRRTS